MSKREKKKLLRIRKMFDIFKRFAVLISAIGVFVLIYVMFNAPLIVEKGNYYAALFACIAGILFGPAVYFVEEQIKYDGKKEDSNVR